MFPKWIEDYSSNPIRIRENTPVDTVIYSLKALSSIADPEVTYFIKPGNTPEQNGEPRSFYSTTIQSNMSMALKVYRGLDFEQTSDYKLTIRVSVCIAFFCFTEIFTSNDACTLYNWVFFTGI